MIRLITAYTLSECMEVMGACAAENERAGERNLVFCEDRLTLIAERTLVKSTGGTFDSAVTTFARFIQADEKVLGKQGSVMAVGKIIAALQRAGEMKCFTEKAPIASRAKSAYETLAQFSASCVDSQALFDAAAELPVGALKNKLEDLAKIAAGYEKFLADSGYLDEGQYLSLLPKALEEEDLTDTTVFFLCFSSFTKQALRAVEKAARKAKNVVGIFCDGKEDFYTGEGAKSFLRVCQKVGEVQVEDFGTPLDGEAEILRQNLFNAEYLSKEAYPTDAVKIFSATDRTAEAEYAAVQIKKQIEQNPNLRYRDIAVLLPQTDEYALSVKKAFEEYDIPYFTDEKKSLKSHPLCAFLLSVFRAVAERCSPNVVQALTGNYFFGEADEYRNYLYRHANFRGGALRALKEGVEGYDAALLIEGRERLLSLLDLVPAKASGKAYCVAVRSLLNKAAAQEKLDLLCDGLDDLSLKGYLGQFFPALEKVLAEAELLTGDSVLRAEEFATLLEEGLGAMEISLIPLKMDAVFVGDLCDSRIEKVRVLFALGLTEEVPHAQADDAFISDTELARLDRIKLQIDPTIGQVNARVKEAAALNLCTFTEALYLTYPLSVGDDSPALSDLLRYVQGVFCCTDKLPLLAEKGLDKEDFIYACSSAQPAIRRLLVDKRRLEKGKEEDDERYASLYTALSDLGVYAPKEAGQGLIDGAIPLFFDGDRISPTALERYFACPFKLFAERGLRLEERQEAELVAVDTGNFVHAVLERVVKEIEDCADETAFCQKAKQIGEGLFSEPAFALDSENAANLYLKRSLIEESALAATAVYRQIKRSGFSKIETEKTIRTDTLKGKVDRVDISDKYLRIIDYKTGGIEVTPVSYYVGEKLQMQLYMAALKGEKTPAGIFYFPTERTFKKEASAPYKLQGFINGDEEALRCGDSSITEGKKSDLFEAQLGKNRSALVMSGEDFQDFLDYAPMVAEKAREEIKSGYVLPNPYDGACKYCKLGGACGYDCYSQQVRAEEGASVQGIIRIVREAKEGKEDGDL